MHEISIVQSTLDLALQTAKASSASQILTLHLRVGVMTGVVPEALQFAFDALREGTMASAARLEIETVAATSWCSGCLAEFESMQWPHACPLCGSVAPELRHGLELELVSLEVT